MFSLFERSIAVRYLRARRSEGFISVIAGFSFMGIMLGVATLIIVMSVMNGFRQELMGRILGFNGHIGVYVNKEPMPDYQEVTSVITTLSEVKSAIPLVERQVMVTRGSFSRGAMVHGLLPTDLPKRGMTMDKIVEGNLSDFTGEKILIGSRMAKELRVHAGDKVTFISPDGTPTAFGTAPRLKAFEVAAIFEVGMRDYDGGVVLVPITAAQSFFRMPNDISNIQVFLHDPAFVPKASTAIAAMVGKRGEIIDWQKSNAQFFSVINVERNVMFLILSLIIIIAAFNVISSMIMLVKDKGKDIAILRTLGVQRSSILRIFLLTGSSIGIMGTLVGLVVGVVFSLNIESIRQGIQMMLGTQLFPAEIYFLSQLPSQINPHEVLTTVLMSLSLSILATLYPSWRAARLDPVEALRYE